MKRITTILLAIAMLLAAPAFFTSCQEDAPEINYTMNVSVINDFTKVVEAINNGFLKNEEAIKKLTESIDKMNADQQTKLQAIIDVLNSVNATLETKLAAIEAAMQAQTLMLEAKLDLLEKAVNNQTIKIDEMGTLIATAIDKSRDELAKKLAAIYDIIESTAKTQAEKLAAIQGAIQAQTLSLEEKLGLLEAAIKALPDYSSQLAAIETAIKNLPDYGDKLDAIATAIKAIPDYSDKFDAVVTALGEMKAQVEALGTAQAGIVTEIGNTTAAINDLVAAVNSGNTAAAAALADIVKKLEELKKKIGNGGGSGGGSGGGNKDDEYGSNPDFNRITFVQIIQLANKMSKKSFKLHKGIFLFKTNEGRLGKAEVYITGPEAFDTNKRNRLIFVLSYVLYNSDGTVYTKASYTINAKTKTSGNIDFDSGSLGSGIGTDCHIALNVETFHDPYDHRVIVSEKFTPKNGARLMTYLKYD